MDFFCLIAKHENSKLVQWLVPIWTIYS